MSSLKESKAGRVEEQLRRQLDLTRAITDSLGEGVYALDAKGRVTFMNRAAERMLGWREAELLGKNMHEAVHFQREDGTRVASEACPLLGVIRSGETHRSDDDVFTRKDGTLIPVAYTSSPIISDGKVTGAVLAFRDMTERRKVEQSLRESQEFAQAVLDSLSQHVAVLDHDGAIIAVNDAWGQFSHTNDGANALRGLGVGTNYLAVCGTVRAGGDGDEAPAVIEGIRGVLEGSVPSFTLEYPCHSPTEDRWFLLQATPLRRREGGAVVAHLDISARKRVEAELRASERRYHALTDAMPQLVWATDADGSHYYYNRRWYDFTGLSVEESLGFGFTNALHPDDKQHTLERWQAAWRDGTAYDIEYRFYSKPLDEYRWFLGRAVPVRDESGKVVQWVGTCTDIEEQKRMGETLAGLYRERERMFEEVSTPIVPVWEGMVVMPIIGSLDTARMEQAMQTALAEVSRRGTCTCVIDITGARLIDSHAVANLGTLVAALRLVGAEAVVTGVGRHAAQSLVGLGMDLSGVRTRRTLAEALASIIRDQSRGLNRGVARAALNDQ